MTIPGIVAIFVALHLGIALVARFAPRDLAWFLFRPRGITPSGEGGTFTRRDALRALAAAWAVAVLLLLIATLAFTFAIRWPNESSIGQVAMVYSFTAMILALVAFAIGLIALWNALRGDGRVSAIISRSGDA
jgi:hypothetical protein